MTDLDYSGVDSSEPGTYTYTVICSDGVSSDTDTGTVIVLPAPTADFTADKTSGCAPLTVIFTDQSTGNPTSWSWDIDGDGIEDYNTQNPSHTYSAPGTYTVSLTVSNDCGDDTETKTEYITAEDCPPMSARLVLLPETGSNPVGTTHDLTATVYDQFDNVMEGVDVTWTIESGPGSFVSQETTTDANGEAHAVISSSVTGTTTVRCEVAGDASVYDTATKTWTVEAPVATTLELTPESATNILPGDDSHQFMVTVEDQYGNPMAGQVVSLSATFGTLSVSQVTTGDDGTATFTISSTTTGTATITATLGTLSDTSTKTWTSEPAPSGGGGGGGCPATRYLTVDWEGNNTTKPLYSNDKLAADLLGPSVDLSHSLLLERGTHAPIVDGRTHYLIVVRELQEIPLLPENLTAIVVFNVTPAGALFDHDIFLTLGIEELPENALNVTMAYYDDVNLSWEALDFEAGEPSGVAELTFSAAINHFSIFGVLAELAPTPPSPASFAASGLNVERGVKKIWERLTFVTKTGQSVIITANVANDGGQEGTRTVVLNLNGETVDTKTVTLGAGQSQQVKFTQSELGYGQYDVEVADLSGEFTLSDEFTASRTITWWLIIVIIVAIGLIIWGVVWGRRRKRKAQQEA